MLYKRFLLYTLLQIYCHESNCFPIIFFKTILRLFLRVCKWGRGAKGGGEGEKERESRLQTQYGAQLKTQSHDPGIMT